MKNKIDYNSHENQRIKSDFIRREVFTCFSYEMDEILKKEIISYEDIENLYLDCEKHYKDLGYDSAEAMQDDGADMQEIFEWWIVSDWLYEKLKAKGEPVLEWGNNSYWGRCCTGQAIMLDSVIDNICSDMEILEGQQYSWSKKNG
jgi:hypothetical protein